MHMHNSHFILIFLHFIFSKEKLFHKSSYDYFCWKQAYTYRVKCNDFIQLVNSIITTTVVHVNIKRTYKIMSIIYTDTHDWLMWMQKSMCFFFSFRFFSLDILLNLQLNRKSMFRPTKLLFIKNVFTIKYLFGNCGNLSMTFIYEF